MKKCQFLTLGCKVNQYETQAIRESLSAVGCVEATSGESADVCVINTCAVTAGSDQKSRQLIRKAVRENPDARVFVTGCCVEQDAEMIRDIPGVDHIVRKKEAGKISELVSGLAPAEEEKDHFDPGVSGFEEHDRAFIKIQDGCESACSYCVVPQVRGPMWSRSLPNIIAEAERLADSGFKEIVLTGIHLGMYGKDVGGEVDLSVVLHDLLKISAISRIRLSSIEIGEVTDGLIDLMADSERICPHLHIPLQSGDDEILQRMNRTYSRDEFRRHVERIKEALDQPAITTDVIVGFPGEGERHFRNTVDLCEEIGFARMHVFPFSPRKRTVAAELADQCDGATIKRRSTHLRDCAAQLALQYKEKRIGKTARVLVESQRDMKTGKLCGYTERYIRALFDGSDSLAGTIVPVTLERATPEAVFCSQAKKIAAT